MEVPDEQSLGKSNSEINEPGRDQRRAVVLNRGDRNASEKIKPGDENVPQGWKQVVGSLGRA